eukprot:TRINITY_DN233_c1_g7_i2.p2 TRINITY_DN233_c1_g7~~TRINITY_DN233_c1_g7_i2.p2  ORF type:complete len:195 (+),score=55.22 TRINITY_DN233_c1_g7_i2:66-650(+)
MHHDPRGARAAGAAAAVAAFGDQSVYAAAERRAWASGAAQRHHTQRRVALAERMSAVQPATTPPLPQSVAPVIRQPPPDTSARHMSPHRRSVPPFLQRPPQREWRAAAPQLTPLQPQPVPLELDDALPPAALTDSVPEALPVQPRAGSPGLPEFLRGPAAPASDFPAFLRDTRYPPGGFMSPTRRYDGQRIAVV